MIGLLLFIIAYVAGIIFLPIGFIFGAFTFTNDYKKIAISIDQLGNVILAPIMNLIFIKKDGFKFGEPDMTISMVLGVNKQRKKLTYLGIFVALFLNKIEKDHVEKAIEADKNELDQEENR
jgi:8-oxo-dGTP diphosphatase